MNAKRLWELSQDPNWPGSGTSKRNVLSRFAAPVLGWLLLCSQAGGAFRYVDSAVATSGDGKSWATAWKALSNITGLSAGDKVYFSTGTYTTAGWTPAGGTSGNPITYTVSTDSGHNGIVTFSPSGGGTQFINGDVDYVTLDGRDGSSSRMVISAAFDYFVYDPGGGGVDTNLKLLGITFSSQVYLAGDLVEIGWCTGNAPLTGLDDSFITAVGDGASTGGFGRNSIHDCVLTVPRKKTSGEGWDCIKWGQNTDVYNNIIRAVYNASYTGGQHNDALQVSGNYMRVYNNYFENFLSYIILNEIFDDTDSAHWRIYNNVVYYSNESGVDWGAQQVFAFGGNSDTTTSASLTDVICANNTVVSDAPNTRGSFFCHLYPGINPPVGADCYFVNNAADDFAPITQAGSGVLSNNVQSSTVASVVNKAIYPNQNFRPTSGSTATIDKGISPSYLTSVYTTDADGNTRTGTWDVGAYEYGSGGGNPTPTPSPTTTPTPTPSPTPTPPSGLSFAAKDGVITAPFAVDANGDVSQATDTGIPGSGRAAYFFTITDAGLYDVLVVVSAPDDGTNSFFVNIDSEPTDPTMIWDIIPFTNGFESRTVGWRGTGTFNDPQFPVKDFNLSSGTHQLIIRGREANVKMRMITIVPAAPEPPTGLKILPP
jgi:hypothetical protein